MLEVPKRRPATLGAEAMEKTMSANVRALRAILVGLRNSGAIEDKHLKAVIAELRATGTSPDGKGGDFTDALATRLEGDIGKQ